MLKKYMIAVRWLPCLVLALILAACTAPSTPVASAPTPSHLTTATDQVPEEILSSVFTVGALESSMPPVDTKIELSPVSVPFARPPGIPLESELDVKPLPRLRPVAAYPYQLRKGGITGRVIIGVVVGEDGHVSAPIVYSATDTRFAESTISMVKRWLFVPGTRNGRPTACLVVIPIHYEFEIWK